MTVWEDVQDQFVLRASKRNLSSLLMASHPREVSYAIELHRQAFDRDPVDHLFAAAKIQMPRFVNVAGRYFGVKPANVAQCGNTTQGLGYIYSGIRLRPGERVLTSKQEFDATLAPLAARQRRQDSTFVDELPLLFDETPTVDQFVTRLRDHITPATRLLALTWVYSSRGVKSPIPEITAMVRELNASRDPDTRVLVCVDGVHGFGIEDVNFADLGCDYFVSGTHKWIYGARGTGVMYATPEAWRIVEPIFWTGMPHSPNGVHAYEHDFAVANAFDWLLSIGKAEIQQRVRALATRLKDGLSSMKGVRLITPRNPALSSGIVCFDVLSKAPDAVVASLADDYYITATQSATDVLTNGKHVRVSPGIVNDEDDIDAVLTAVERIART